VQIKPASVALAIISMSIIFACVLQHTVNEVQREQENGKKIPVAREMMQ